jgi:stage III sporulation protein AC
LYSKTNVKKKIGGLEMDVNLIFKIAAIGIIVAVLNRVLTQSGRDEIAMMTTLAGTVVVLLMVVGLIAKLFDTVKTMFQL